MEEYWYVVELIERESKKVDKVLKKVITATNGLHFDVVQHIGYLSVKLLKAIPDGLTPPKKKYCGDTSTTDHY